MILQSVLPMLLLALSSAILPRPPAHARPKPAATRSAAAHAKAVARRLPTHPRPGIYAPAVVSLASRTALVGRLTEALASPAHGIENAAALQPFFDQLHLLQTNQQLHPGPVRILQFGDSHTASDTFTGPMRTLFQSRFGDGGAGYSYPGYPFAGYKIHGTRRAQSAGWTVTGTHFRELGDGLLGMAGVSLSTSRPGCWISLDADAVSLEVQYLVQPGGGSIEISDNGQPLQTISTDGPLAAGHFDSALPPGEHHIEVRTTSDAPVRLFGMRTEEATGVTYESMGLNGAEASLLLKYDEPVAHTLMEQRNVALVVLAYGTNEAADPNWTEESYAAMFRRLVERIRRLAPGAAILVIGPADRDLRTGTRRRSAWTPSLSTDRIIRAQRTVCRELDCAFWDERARMGGFGTMHEWVQAGWAQPDHTHFTGEGYTELAAALFSDIVHEYTERESAPAPASGEER